jgi:hypothetical protein
MSDTTEENIKHLSKLDITQEHKELLFKLSIAMVEDALIQQEQNGVFVTSEKKQEMVFAKARHISTFDRNGLQILNHSFLSQKRYGESFIVTALKHNGHKSDDEIIQYIEKNPDSFKVKHTNGQYPLSLACEYNHTDRVVLYLLHKFPEAAAVQDNDGWYPL